MKKSIVTSFSLDRPTNDTVDALAASLGLTKSGVIRKAVGLLLEATDMLPPQVQEDHEFHPGMFVSIKQFIQDCSEFGDFDGRGDPEALSEMGLVRVLAHTPYKTIPVAWAEYVCGVPFGSHWDLTANGGWGDPDGHVDVYGGLVRSTSRHPSLHKVGTLTPEEAFDALVEMLETQPHGKVTVHWMRAICWPHGVDPDKVLAIGERPRGALVLSDNDTMVKGVKNYTPGAYPAHTDIVRHPYTTQPCAGCAGTERSK